ncbi:MAG TPA: YjbH domain-containing protein, partial [Longimicrobiaceae bacterium]|nr:YjbH domain-containing protein [Longimicrobiaceae bacterium]
MRCRQVALAAAATLAAAAASGQGAAGPALGGTTGLVNVPTAGMPADGELTLGLHLVDRRLGWPLQERPALVQFASLGFLPFVEVGVGLSYRMGVARQGIGDRLVSVRVRLLEEGARTPAVVVG